MGTKTSEPRSKLYTVADVPADLERAWLQHLRDFDTAHPGCHFEVIAEGPDRPFMEMLEALQVNPALKVATFFKRGRP